MSLPSSTEQHTRPKRWRPVLGMLFVLLVAWLMPLSASANSGVSQGYTTTANGLEPGMIMGLSSKASSAEPASSGQRYQLLGLVADDPLIALNDGKSQVQIVVSGTSKALVSDINGPIKAGDKITASPIEGVGMKAIVAGQIVGTAQTDFSTNNTTSETLTDKYGKKQTVRVGLVALQVSVSYYAGASNDSSAFSSFLPPFILHLANGIAGKQVSPLRVFMALLAILLGFVIAGIMLQAAIRSGIIAVGRNPLAKKALRRELVDVCITALGVLILTIIITYVIVKL